MAQNNSIEYQIPFDHLEALTASRLNFESNKVIAHENWKRYGNKPKEVETVGLAPIFGKFERELEEMAITLAHIPFEAMLVVNMGNLCDTVRRMHDDPEWNFRNRACAWDDLMKGIDSATKLIEVYFPRHIVSQKTSPAWFEKKADKDLPLKMTDTTIDLVDLSGSPGSSDVIVSDDTPLPKPKKKTRRGRKKKVKEPVNDTNPTGEQGPTEGSV